MDTMTEHRARRHGWYAPEDCRLDDLVAVAATPTDPGDYPYADTVELGALVYGDRLRAALPQARRAVQAELVRALTDGPGLVVFRGAFEPVVVDRATAVFEQVVEEERRRGGAVGDHFAAPGANDRVWGALDKLALREPELFAQYYDNDVLALVCEAWLGPGYQVTSQVNVVRPGGAAQVAHRDYHLGFMSLEQAAAYPAHVHRLSPALTLQGAVAHGDMPVETGPTMYLPHSHRWGPGYLGFHRPEVSAFFDEHHVQLPLSHRRRGVLQPRAAARRRHQPHGRTCVGRPTCCRSRRRSAGRWSTWTAPRCAGRCSRCWRPGGQRAWTRPRWTGSWPPRRRATPSPPSSTPTSRSAGARPQTQAELLRRALVGGLVRRRLRQGARRAGRAARRPGPGRERDGRHRRRPHLVGRLRGARAGATSCPGTACCRRCGRSAWSPPSSVRRASCPASRRRWPGRSAGTACRRSAGSRRCSCTSPAPTRCRRWSSCSRGTRPRAPARWCSRR